MSKIDGTTFAESPDTVHGRLLELAHLAGYTFERAHSELRWLLTDGRWKTVGSGFNDVNAFLATIDLTTFKMLREQRREISLLCEQAEASQRATARALGVDHMTVRSDLAGENSSRSKTKAKKIKADAKDGGENSPPMSIVEPDASEQPASTDMPSPPQPWFQNAADPSKLAKRRERQEEKREAREAFSASMAERNAKLPPGERKYGAILVDPPWPFEVRSETGKDRSVENHYPTMSVDDITALSVEALAADHCVLFLWVTMPFLPVAFEVISAWGFTYKTCAFVWVKETQYGQRLATGAGYWTRSNVELCLLATRGKPDRVNADVHQVIQTPRREHSRKPDEVYERVERLVRGPHIELFARKVREGWDRWGNQAPAAEHSHGGAA